MKCNYCTGEISETETYFDFLDLVNPKSENGFSNHIYLHSYCKNDCMNEVKPQSTTTEFINGIEFYTAASFGGTEIPSGKIEFAECPGIEDCDKFVCPGCDISIPEFVVCSECGIPFEQNSMLTTYSNSFPGMSFLTCGHCWVITPSDKCTIVPI